jgi:ABC-2 type transport system permease protein
MNALAGTGALIRLILRRDRFILPVWILWLVFIPISGVSAFREIYPTTASFETAARALGTNPGLVTLYGPLFGLNMGAVLAWRYGSVAWILALVSFLTVIRHTRTDEEMGRRQLLGSTVVGRQAPLAAALIVTLGANLLHAAITAGAIIGMGLPVLGSVGLGLAWALAGCMFAALGGVTAQLAQGARPARGLAGAVLGLAFLLRAAGDAGGQEGRLSWLSWLSPLGWVHRVRPFAGENWWPFVLMAGVVAVLSAAAYALSSRRDIGAGILPPRLGPATASPRLRSPLALAWRLQWGTLIAWTAGFAVMGAVLSASAQGIADLLTGSPELTEFFAQLGGAAGVIDMTLSAYIGIFGLLVSGYAIQAVLRLGSEEAGLRAEPILATRVGRLRWVASHLAFAVVGPALILAVTGLLVGLVYGLNVGDVGREVTRMLGAAMVQLPAVWVLGAVAVAVFGLLPRLMSFNWAVFAVVVFLGFFGPLFQLPQWTLDILPFTHIPKLPGAELTVEPLIWLTAIAVALTAVGLAAFRFRDIGRA